MSVYIDKKYINLISSTLEKFKWKKNNLANCRCPICGDSETNKNKARGYFFPKEDAYFFKCHNCGISHNVYKFLEIVSPSLFKEYCLEKFTEKNNIIFDDNSNPIVEPIPSTIMPVENINYDLVENLPDDHKAVVFLKQRMIPKEKWNSFYYTDLFGTFAREINSDYKLIEDERLIIPIIDEHNQLIGCQGRSFGNQKPKYITLKKNDNIKLIYGLDTVDKSKPIFVVEGPIDSLFLPNAIACLGVGNFLEVRNKFQNEDLIFVVDNEPRNNTVVSVLRDLISNNEKVCIFPKHIKEKDINDMVLSGIDVCDMITTHTYRGASAMLNYNSWRKC